MLVRQHITKRSLRCSCGSMVLLFSLTPSLSIEIFSTTLCVCTAGKVPVTVVVADDVIYMGQENFHHWPLPRLQELPPKQSLEPPFSSVECKDVTDIEEIVSHTCMVLYEFCLYVHSTVFWGPMASYSVQ